MVTLARMLGGIMNRTQCAFIAVALAGCLTVGCTKRTASDQALKTDIQSKLYADNTTKAANISVDVKNGAVTLSGDVPSSDVELEAMKVANSTAGVAGVNDQMKVNSAAATNPAPNTDTAQPAPMPAPASQPTPTPPPAVQRAPATPAPEPAPAAADGTPATPVRREPVTVTIPAGTRLQVRMVDGIDSKVNSAGQTFQATLDSPLTHGSRVAVPAGAPVTILLGNVTSAGRIKGRSGLEVRATALNAGGRTYQLSTDVYDQAGSARGKQTAIRTGIGAAAGALIGGLAGGGKGAAIGSAAGGGAGIGYQVFTHGQQVKIPSETVLTFRLEAPLSIRR